mmetsp:Transcript_68940/g.143936  ORF Transcript_68940/g.143936 Transcript_68940/m.143936 type:complete len:120 (-) Transcript_68940:74-433(-)
MELFLLTLGVDNDHGLVAGASDDLEGPELDVGLDDGVRELAADQTLCVENSVFGIACHLVLSSVTNQTFGVGEGNIGGSSAVALIVGDNFDAIVLPHTDTGISCAKVDADRRLLGHREK